MSNHIAQVMATTAAALLLVTACGDQSILSPTVTGAQAAKGGNNPITLSVRGSGHVTVVGTRPGFVGIPGWRTFTVNATMRADGNVSGNTEYNDRADGGSLEQADVVCMRDLSYIPGLAGWVLIGAQVNHRVSDFAPNAVPPLPAAVVGVNHGILFAVKDNGEGAGASPDQITQAANTIMQYVHLGCAGSLDPYVPGLIGGYALPVEAGNIQVSGN